MVASVAFATLIQTGSVLEKFFKVNLEGTFTDTTVEVKSIS